MNTYSSREIYATKNVGQFCRNCRYLLGPKITQRQSASGIIKHEDEVHPNNSIYQNLIGLHLAP